MSNWRERMQQGAVWYDGRPIRERVLILATSLVAILYIGWELAVAPAYNRADIAGQQARDLQNRQQELSVQQAELEVRLGKDPSGQVRQQIRNRQGRLEELEQRIAETTDRLVTPVAMVSLLKDILATQKELVLKEVKLLPPTPVYGEARSAEDAGEGESRRPEQEPLLYAHEAELVIGGQYLPLLAWLKRLERMDQRLGWVSLDYDASDYSESKARIRVRTLSLQKAWLGV
jgi:MSHA biogenesis protein MshJ